jgi:hypothetical protein
MTMTTAISFNDDDQQTDRQARLEYGVAALKLKARAIPVERLLFMAGCALVPLGMILILLGWYGAAHTTLLQEQVPYLISGGVLGLTLAALGGFFYFGYWLTRQVNETRRHTQEQAEQTQRQHDQLIAALARVDNALAAGARRSVTRRPQRVPSTDYLTAGDLIATAHGTMLHRPDCTIVAKRRDLRSMAPDTPGFTPCGICKPFS